MGLCKSNRGVVVTTGFSRLQSSTRLTSNRRAFSWAAKYTSSSSNHGRDLYDKMKKITPGRQVCRYAFLDRQLFPRRYLFNQGWRLANSWRSRDNTWERTDQEPRHENSIKKEEEGDRYSRWELQRKKQYEEFKRWVDEDPFSALFGKSNRWLGWTTGTESSAARTVEPDRQTYSSHLNAESDVQGMKQRADTRGKVNMNKEEGCDQQSQSPSAAMSQEEEYYIDPITMRKVSKPLASSVDSPTQDAHRASEVPVKTFKASSKMNETPDETVAGVRDWTTAPQVEGSAQDWLVQEGFNYRGGNGVDTNVADASPEAKTSKIESALDRHLQGKTTDAERPGRPGLLYEARERRTEDVDLLRASDIRASAGLRGRAARESAVEKRARQIRLEELYGNQNAELENRLSQEAIAKTVREMKSDRGVKDEATTLEHDVSLLNELSDPEQTTSLSNDSTVKTSFKMNEEHSIEDPKGRDAPRTDDEATRITAKLVPLKSQIELLRADYDAMRRRWLEEIQRSKTSKKTREMHDEEVKAQKAAMEAMEMRSVKLDTRGWHVPSMAETMERGEGDIAANVHEFASRARWYKRKAPHAKDEMDAKLQRIANDKLFIREIRSIYEETYGTIDAQHRQPQANDNDGTNSLVTPKHRPDTTKDLSNAGEPSPIMGQQTAVNSAGIPSTLNAPASDTTPTPTPTTYRILAYDSSSQKITSVKTTSLTPFDKEQPLTPLEALVALQNPAKFLTQVMALHHKGYDIICGAPNILVMKKVRNPQPTVETSTSKSDDQPRRPNPIDGTTSTTGNYASPTGFVNHDSVIPPEELENHRPSPTPSATGAYPSTAKVRREEDVFSGTPRQGWQDANGRRLSKKNKREARRRKTFRRMLLTGTVTAACCYAVGVAVEFMRV